MINDPVLDGLLELLPTPGEPFPKMEGWLKLFRAWLDYTYPLPDARGSVICPLCGGPKSAYAIACIKHNAGTEGNVGGPGGDTRSPAVREVLADARATGGPVVIKPSDLSDTQRKEFGAALRNGASAGRLVEITAPKQAPPPTPDMRSAGIDLHPPGVTYCPEPGCEKRCRPGWDKCKQHHGQPFVKPTPIVGAWPAPVVAGRRVRPEIPKYDRCPECTVNTKLSTDERCPRCQALRNLGVRAAGVKAG